MSHWPPINKVYIIFVATFSWKLQQLWIPWSVAIIFSQCQIFTVLYKQWALIGHWTRNWLVLFISAVACETLPNIKAYGVYRNKHSQIGSQILYRRKYCKCFTIVTILNNQIYDNCELALWCTTVLHKWPLLAGIIVNIVRSDARIIENEIKCHNYTIDKKKKI